LDALATLHFGAPIDTNTVLTAKRRERAYQVAHYAPTRTFIPAPADLEDEESGDEEEEEAEDTAQNDTANDEPAASGQAPESSSPDAPEFGSV
jgi:single-stranded DNA-binding protein